MATTKTRINISLSDQVHQTLARLAHRDRIPQATKATQLLELALDLEEDQLWDGRAQQRDTAQARFVSHESAWR